MFGFHASGCEPSTAARRAAGCAAQYLLSARLVVDAKHDGIGFFDFACIDCTTEKPIAPATMKHNWEISSGMTAQATAATSKPTCDKFVWR
jgi:hypothetical protein